MVKGLSRKIIIVKSPDPKIFEQAIFIVRDEYLSAKGIDQKELMRQANEAASGYVDNAYGLNTFQFPKMMIYAAVVLGIMGIITAACILI
jgi:hypothetical protein